jgi:hypothetical protein
VPKETSFELEETSFKLDETSFESDETFFELDETSFELDELDETPFEPDDHALVMTKIENLFQKSIFVFFSFQQIILQEIVDIITFNFVSVVSKDYLNYIIQSDWSGMFDDFLNDSRVAMIEISVCVLSHYYLGNWPELNFPLIDLVIQNSGFYKFMNEEEPIEFDFMSSSNVSFNFLIFFLSKIEKIKMWYQVKNKPRRVSVESPENVVILQYWSLLQRIFNMNNEIRLFLLNYCRLDVLVCDQYMQDMSPIWRYNEVQRYRKTVLGNEDGFFVVFLKQVTSMVASIFCVIEPRGILSEKRENNFLSQSLSRGGLPLISFGEYVDVFEELSLVPQRFYEEFNYPINPLRVWKFFLDHFFFRNPHHECAVSVVKHLCFNDSEATRRLISHTFFRSETMEIKSLDLKYALSYSKCLIEIPDKLKQFRIYLLLDLTNGVFAKMMRTFDALAEKKKDIYQIYLAWLVDLLSDSNFSSDIKQFFDQNDNYARFSDIIEAQGSMDLVEFGIFSSLL